MFKFFKKKRDKTVIKSEIIISGFNITVLKKDIKNLHLNILPPDGKVRVSAPKRIDDGYIRGFIVSKLPWIEKNVNRFKELHRETPPEYISGESHYFKGERYLLNVIAYDGKPYVSINDKKYICFFIKKDTTTEERKKIFLNWQRKELAKELSDIFDIWQAIMGVSVNEIRIKQMKTKWGTCNIKAKRIWINLELIKKPVYCIEYIVVHELAHLIEKNHNKRFKEIMDRFLPSWRNYKKELNGPFLSVS
ncbi:MAG: M48 family metallopeptidase [Candidatus Acidulodesulfobacterium sp.]